MNINAINKMSFAGKIRFIEPLRTITHKGEVQMTVFDADYIKSISPEGIYAYVDTYVKHGPDEHSCDVMRINDSFVYKKPDNQPFTDTEYSAILAAYTAAKVANQETIINVNI